jgi:hypothetical protein
MQDAAGALVRFYDREHQRLLSTVPLERCGVA